MIPKKDADALKKIIEAPIYCGDDSHTKLLDIGKYIEENTRHDNRTDRQRQQSRVNGAKGGRPKQK